MIKQYEDFVKIAGLVSDMSIVPEHVKVAAFNTYSELPGIPANAMLMAIKQASDNNQKVAFEMIGAALSYDSGLLKDYGDNKDLAKHAGLASWFDKDELSKTAGVGTKALKWGLTTNSGFATVGAAATVGTQAVQKKNMMVQGTPEGIQQHEAQLNNPNG